jgi:putative peptidoglycan lipid II flippase
MAPPTGRLAGRVAAGIIVTRVLGFVRERLFARYFGNGPAADAFRAALKIPNLIRNLLGEGTLSASFIPVYAAVLQREGEEAGRRLAGVIASLLILLTAGSALVGIVFAPVITDFVAPGFSGPTRDLTVTLVQILFPMSGLMILSAWCLVVLNTHGRFFLSYAAPSMWNIAQIATLVGLGSRLVPLPWEGPPPLVIALAWGALVGSGLQVLVQLPGTLRRLKGIYWSLELATTGVRQVIRAWLPVVFGAGVGQVSSIIDTHLASFLGGGAVAALGYTQLLSTLPLSLFGVSIAAAALPDLSRDAAGQAIEDLRRRIGDGLRRLAFFVLPSAFALAALGRPMVAALFQTGRFSADDTRLVTGVLAAYAIGVPAQASVKLLASGFYAQGDTRTPVWSAAISVVVAAGSAFVLMRWLGPAGIGLGSSIGAYLNVSLHYRGLTARVGRPLGRPEVRAIATTLAGCGGATLGASLVPAAGWTPWPTTVAALAVFLVAYQGLSLALRHPDAAGLLRLVTGR